MISASISGNSLKRAGRDVSRSFRKKSFRSNRGLMKKASRRFRNQARLMAKDLAKSISTVSGLSLAQAKRRAFPSKKISGSRLHAEVYSRGGAQDIHIGRLRSLKVKRKGKGKGVYLRGRKISGAFIARETLHGKKELRRVLIRENRRIKPLTDKKTVRRVFSRSGPLLLRRHANKLLKEIAALVAKA